VRPMKNPLTARRAAALVAPLLLLGSDALAQGLAVRAGTVHTGTGPAMQGATVLVQDGKITAIGAELDLPEGVRLVEHPGHLSAGMIALRDLAGTQGGASDSTRAMLPAAELRHAYNPGHHEFEQLLAGGITSVQIAADPRALVAGMTAVVKTHGDSVVHPRSYLAVALGEDAIQTGRYPTSYGAALDELSAQIEAAEGAFAMVKMRNLPLWMHVEERHEVQRCLDFLAAHELGGVLHGAERIGEHAERLSELGLGASLPSFKLGGTYHAARSSVALAEAGVPFGFALDSPGNDASALRLSAAAAMRAGLGAGRAWGALTSDAAKLCRVEGRVGTLAPGLDADLVLWSGSPVDLGSRVMAVYVDGEHAWALPEDEHEELVEELEEDAESGQSSASVESGGEGSLHQGGRP